MKDVTIEQRLDKAKLNWTVRTETVKTESGIIIPKHVAIVREDTNRPLSVRGDSYQLFQNHELMELLDKVAAKTGLPIHKGGYFGHGEKVYIQLKSDTLKLGTDRVQGFVTGINSFDGSTSLGFGNSTTTISCQNTFFKAFRELASKIRHTKNMMTKVDEIALTVERAVEEEGQMFKHIKRMSEVKMDDKVKDLVTRALFNIGDTLDLESDKDISTVTRNKLSRFNIDLNGELQEKKDNLWGLFSGVTKFTTHSISKHDNTESKLFGIYGKRERQIFNMLADEANKSKFVSVG